MANAVAQIIVSKFPYGKGTAVRGRYVYDGQIIVEPGNFPAPGIPLLWNRMIAAPDGNRARLQTTEIAPIIADVQSTLGLYTYSVSGLAEAIDGPVVFCSNVALTSNVATITAVNSFVAGQLVTLNGFVGASFLNGATVAVSSTGLSAASFQVPFTNANYSSTADTGFAFPVPAPDYPPPFFATSFAIASNVLTVQVPNNLVAGQYVTLAEFGIGTYLNLQTLLVATASGTQFTASFTHANVASTTDGGSVTVQTAFLNVIPGAGATNAAATSTQFAITSNIATVTATNTFTAGDRVLLQGFTTATYFNGLVATINATGTTGSAYTFNIVHANVGTTADTTGTATRVSISVGSAVPLAVTNDNIAFHAEFAE